MRTAAARTAPTPATAAAAMTDDSGAAGSGSERP
jgi:hypothetical protein